MHKGSEISLDEIKSFIDGDPLGVLYTDQEIESVNSIVVILQKNGVRLQKDDLYIILDFYNEIVHDYRSRMKVSVTEAKTEGKVMRGKFELLRTGQRIAEYYYWMNEKRFEITAAHKSRPEILLLDNWGEDMGRELGAYYDELFNVA